MLGNDTDADADTLTAGSASTPAHGVVTLNANGSFTYTPTAGYSGPDSFTYVVSDGHGGSANGTVSITVSAAVLRHVVADFNGDGTTELSVFRPSTGAWFLGSNPPVYLRAVGRRGRAL